MTPLSFKVLGSQLTVCLSCQNCGTNPIPTTDLSHLAALIAQQLQSLANSTKIGLADPKVGGKHAPRSKSGCLTCRRRRIKCDEQQPTCGQCRKDLDRRCTYGVKLSTTSLAARDYAKDPSPVILSFTPTQQLAAGSQPHPVGLSNASVHRQADMSAMSGTLLSSCQAPTLATLSTSLFLEGVSIISSPALVNLQMSRPTARSERQLVVLWEAFLAGSTNVLSELLTEVTCAIGAAKMSIAERSEASRSTQLLEWSRMAAASVREKIAAQYLTEISDSALHERLLILFQLLLLRDAYVGDPDWTHTHGLCKTYVEAQQGPSQILASAQGSPHQIHLQRSLTYLTVYETFGALSLKTVPSLLNCPTSLWLEDLDCAQEVLHGDFGFSLPTLFLLSSLANIVAGKDKSQPMEAESLFVSLDEVQLASIASTPSPVRIQFGDLLLRHSLICHLLRVVYGLGREHARIQQSGAALLELLVEVTIRTGSMINLLHPLLMAGEVIPFEQRARLELIIATARTKADTADVDAVGQMIKDCWARRDDGEITASVFDGLAPPKVNIL